MVSPNSTDAPAVRVIVVAYQSAAFLPRCLAAIAAQSRGDFDCVVVDNGSSDDPAVALPMGDPRFRLLSLGANLGFAAANNRGAAGFSGRWLALVNPDAFLAPDWLALMCAAAERSGATMLGSTLLLDGDPRQYDGVGDCLSAWGMAWRGGHRAPVRTPHPGGVCFAPCAAAALYDRAAFAAVGGFDERFFCYGEDGDLALRLRLAGGWCLQVGAAVARHVSSGVSGRGSAFARYHGWRNQFWALLRGFPAPLLALALPLHGVAFLLLWLRAALLRDQPGAMARAAWDALAGAGPYWRERSTLQRGRRASVGDFARALTWSPLAFLRRAPDLRPDRRAEPSR